jgi:SH3 domain-containing YSC84-like protein 1
MRMKWAGLMVLGLTAMAAAQAPSTGEVKRVEEAGAVLREIHAVPDKDIPQSLWANARCAIVIPGLKRGAFIVGGEYGKGLMSCRNGNAWGAPVFMEIEKGSWGFQVGAEEVDLVMLVMNERGIDHLLQNKVTLGTEASVAAGPVGRDAQAATDAQMHAEILSWSRSRGVFAGINIAGGVMKPDPDDNQDLYGHPIQPREVLVNPTVGVPDVARPFIAALRAHDAAGATQQP